MTSRFGTKDDHGVADHPAGPGGVAAGESREIGAVACGHPVTAAAAEEILADGGNAFDAIVAAQFAACVAEPVLTSLGGGGFLLAQPAQDAPVVFDFFAQTPRQPSPGARIYPVDADFGTTTQRFHIGPGSMATPGTVAGMAATHRRFGSLPLARLVEPACRAARGGVIINDFQGYIFDVVRPIFSDTSYAGVESGSRFFQPELAATLEAVAAEGEGLFYRGEIARRLISMSEQDQGHLQAADLSEYRVIERAPLSLEYRGHRILTNPPPSAGGMLVAFALRLLDHEEIPPDTARHHSQIIRVMAAVEAARERILAANPDQIDNLAAEFSRSLSARNQVTRGTTHISVIDAMGNAAAMTLSNGEGCGHLIEGTGVMMNNMLGEEDINPGGIGHWEADVRLGSMMAPTLIVSEKKLYALGSGGSNRIRSAILQVIVNLLDRNHSLEEAVNSPRLHLENDLLSVEPGMDQSALAEYRHTDINKTDGSLEIEAWPERNLFFGGVHVAAVFDSGDRFDASGDPRRGGEGRIVRI